MALEHKNGPVGQDERCGKQQANLQPPFQFTSGHISFSTCPSTALTAIPRMPTTKDPRLTKAAPWAAARSSVSSSSD